MSETQDARWLIEKIGEWMQRHGRSREWLANEIGVSTGTVNGWFSPASKRPIPAPTAKLLEHLLNTEELREPQFSYSEYRLIDRAMIKADYDSFSEFARDAVMAKVDRILERQPILKVADDIAEYKVTPKTGNGGSK